VKKSEILRGHGAFRTVANAGRRLDGKHIRSFTVVTRSPAPSFLVGVTVYDRRLPAVVRNRIRRRMREAFARERSKLADAVTSSGVRVETVLGYRPHVGAGGRPVSFFELHEDIARLIDGIISRIHQQWPQQ
jgi:ribonuclease P protein component